MGSDVVVQPPVAAIRAQLQELGPLFPSVVRLLAEGKWEDLGRVAGPGVTLMPTPHSFTFDGRTVFGPRATDTLLFPVILGRAGVVETRCPIDGLPVRVRLTPDAVLDVDPAEAMAGEVRATEWVAGHDAEICGLGSFFATREIAAWWLAQQPDGLIHSVDAGFEIRRQIAIEFGWAVQRGHRSSPNV